MIDSNRNRLFIGSCMPGVIRPKKSEPIGFQHFTFEYLERLIEALKNNFYIYEKPPFNTFGQNLLSVLLI